MQLLNLHDGRLSLEFGQQDWPILRSRMRRVGDVSIRQEATHGIVTLNGVQFILLNDWDEPCLISMSSTGDELLRILMRAGVRRVRSISHRLRHRNRRQTNVIAA
jgi:hypothetical protein